MIRRLLLAAALACGFAVTGGSVAPVAADCRVTKGEFQGYVNVSPPCRLDVFMYNGTYQGQTVPQRCANWGATWLGQEYWQGQWWWVCYNVDY